MSKSKKTNQELMKKTILEPLDMNERLVILLIIAHIVVFISFAVLNFIVAEINGLLEGLIGLMKNINEIVDQFGRLVS